MMKIQYKNTIAQRKVCAGTLYKRLNGKYLNADTPDRATFYYKYKDADGKQMYMCLGTEDKALATRIAIGIDLARNAPEPDAMSLTDIWDQYEANAMGLSSASASNYRQLYNRFIRWTKESAPAEYRGRIKSSDDITREVCRAYVTDVAKHKSTAMRDIWVLRSIWESAMPGLDNPWNTGVIPDIKTRRPQDKSRMITVDEAILFRRALLEMAENRKLRPPRKNATKQLFLDLHDATVFAWYYGMRIGSLASLRWEDFDTGDDYFLHVPPKTQKKRPDPLELPLGIPDVDEVLARRRKNAKSVWLFPEIHALYNKYGTIREAKEGFVPKKSANRTGQAELSSAIKATFRHAGIEDNHRGHASMHGFRKSCANYLASGGVQRQLMCSICGWGSKTDDITNAYVMGQTVEEKREAILRCIPKLSEKVVVTAKKEVARFDLRPMENSCPAMGVAV